MLNDSDAVMKIQTVGNCSQMTQFFIKLIVRGKNDRAGTLDVR